LHLGNVRTALVNFLFARRHGGRFLLRLEDTDLDRSSEGYAALILKDLRWLGLEWDGDVLRQSHRLVRYREQAEVLLQKGQAYPCFCTPEELKKQREEQLRRGEPPGYDGRCSRLPLSQVRRRISRGDAYTIRFRLREGEVTFRDLLRGEVSVSLPQKGDFVILRRDGTPTYHLAVVVDDGDFGVSHVMRGDDHLPNTPRQIKLLEALGYEVPLYCHLPLVREGRSCVMEKRNGESPFSVATLREMGFLPQALLDAVALLGWNTDLSPPLGLKRLVEEFEIDQLGLSSPILTMDHLVSVNKAWLRKMDVSELAVLVGSEIPGISGERLRSLVEVARENSETLGDLGRWIESIELGPEVPLELGEGDKRLLTMVLEEWSRGSPSVDSLRALLRREGLKPKEVMPVVRFALVGEHHGPPLNEILSLLSPSVRKMRDPSPLTGRHFALWTRDNGMMIAQVRVSSDSDTPATPLAAPPDANPGTPYGKSDK